MELHKAGRRSVVLEKDCVVGGLARTVSFKGYRFDIGGHRFFTKAQAVNQFWIETLGSDFLQRERLSRIFFHGKYFDYPLKLTNAILRLGLTTSFIALLSYLKAHFRPKIPAVSLEDYVVNVFGRVLYEIFFKPYTEKVWGIPCNEIGSEWAAQRIRGLSLYRTVRAALFPSCAREIKSLTNVFYYPRLGPGQMWETVRDRMNAAGNPVLTDMEVLSVRHKEGRVYGIVAGRSGFTQSYPAVEVISSMPLRELVEKLDPPVPPSVLRAAQDLRHRSFLAVALIINGPNLFPDNWIYIHEPSVKVGRIQNFGNWSPDLVPDSGRSCLGLEYFCFENDQFWKMEDPDLIELARQEITALNLANGHAVIDGMVVRMAKAYPVYDSRYIANLRIVREYLGRFHNIHTIGRNGLHRYNNQDHSMLTAMLAVRNILGEKHDVWSVNTDCEYHEEVKNTPAIDRAGQSLSGLALVGLKTQVQSQSKKNAG
jgi:protoporphyrinogen oxidase